MAEPTAGVCKGLVCEPKIFEGNQNVDGLRFALVVSQFNTEVTAGLLEGALVHLKKAGVSGEAITVAKVPGAYEIPLVVQQLARTKNFNAIIALGCVIRGDTIHFEMICESVFRSLQEIALATGIAVTSGLVMAEDLEQARARSGGNVANRGEEAAQAALQMANLLRHF